MYRANRKLERGDIRAAYPTQQLADLHGKKYRMRDKIGNPVCCFLHVTDAPDDLNCRKLSNCVWNRPIHEADPHSGGRMHSRQWQVQMDRLHSKTQKEIMQRKEATIAWDDLPLLNKSTGRLA